MLKKMLFGLAAAILATAGVIGATFAAKKPAETKVICCGECRPGDDCLRKCQVIGEVPEDLKLTCCGHCYSKGDDCLNKCGSGKASCCEVKK